MKKLINSIKQFFRAVGKEAELKKKHFVMSAVILIALIVCMIQLDMFSAFIFVMLFFIEGISFLTELNNEALKRHIALLKENKAEDKKYYEREIADLTDQKIKVENEYASLNSEFMRLTKARETDKKKIEKLNQTVRHLEVKLKILESLPMGQTVKQWLEFHASEVSTAADSATHESSIYYTIKGYIVRYADHFATSSVYSLSIVKDSNKDYICIGAPLKLMRVLHTPKEVKLFVESYLFALSCNSVEIKTKAKNKKERAEKRNHKENVREIHIAEAQSIAKAIPTYGKCTDEKSCNEIFKSDIVSSCFSKDWQSRLSQAYDNYPQWRYVLYMIAFKMRLLHEDAKKIIWDAFIDKINSKTT